MKNSYFIQKEDESDVDVRYFAVGQIDNTGKLTGLIYGYEGGGEYSSQLIVDGNYIPTYNEELDEHIEHEEQVEKFEELSSVSLVSIDETIDELFVYDDERCCYICSDGLDSIMDGCTYRENFNTVPPSYANTSWQLNQSTVEIFNAPLSLLQNN